MKTDNIEGNEGSRVSILNISCIFDSRYNILTPSKGVLLNLFTQFMGTLRAFHILLTVGNLIRDTILNPFKKEKMFWHFKAMVSFR